MSEHDLARGVVMGEDGSPEARLMALVAQVRESGPRNTELVGTLNALIERLPSELGPSEAASALQRLLTQEGLARWEDSQGLPCRIVALRTLLELGHPHALAITPEHLEALRRWEREDHPMSWESLVVPLLVASLLQMVFVHLARTDIRCLFQGSVEALAGGPHVEQAWRDGPWGICQGEKGAAFWGLLLANLGAFLFVQHGSGLRHARPGAVGAFLVIGALSLAVAVMQFDISFLAALGAFTSALGSWFVAWRLWTSS